MPVTTPAQTLPSVVERALLAVEQALRPLSPETTANPGGQEAVALVAVLRTFGDLMSDEFTPEALQTSEKLREVLLKTLRGS